MLFCFSLYRNVTLVIDNPDEDNRTQAEIWRKFNSSYKATNGLFLSTEIFGAYYYEALRERYEDNVQYIETRSMLGPVSLYLEVALPISFYVRSRINRL